MHPIIYDVAVSLDGFISGPSGDISKFAHEGPVVDDYAARMAGYSTAIMGRETYVFGYRYGLKAGQNPYPHMKTVVFSDTLVLADSAEVSVMRSATADDIRQLTAAATGPAYLCGGGAFAGWMLEHGLIDLLRLKRSPILLGRGVRLFETDADIGPLKRIRTTAYDSGHLLEEFEI